MHLFRWLPLGLILMAGTATAQLQQYRPNPQAGREMALHTCDACHIVAAGQLAPLVPGYGPSFADIANRPTASFASLQAFLTTYHPRSNCG